MYFEWLIPSFLIWLEVQALSLSLSQHKMTGSSGLHLAMQNLSLSTPEAMEEKQPNQHKSNLLESLKKASKDLQTKPIPIYTYTNLANIKTFLELQTQLDPILSTIPFLSNLTQSLSNL